MAGDGKRPQGLLRSVAATLLLFTLCPSLNCFSLRGLSKNVHPETLVGDAAAATKERIGHIVFNGKANMASVFSSEANGGLAHVDLPQADGTETLGQTWQVDAAQEAAWRRLNPSLTCGETKMKLKAMGPGAADLRLDAGVFNGVARSLPLIQVPRACGYSMRQNAFGLVLVVPYEGCGVIQENGNHVLPMRWLQNPVKLACPVSHGPDATLPPQTTPEPTSTPPLPTTVSPPAMNPFGYPNHPYYPWHPHFHWPQQWHYMVPPATPAPATTTPQPTTTTTKPVTTPATTVPPAMDPAVNPNYPYFSYPYFYSPLGWPQQWHYMVPPATPAPATTTPQPTTTTTKPVTTPATTVPPAMDPAVNPNYPFFSYLPFYPLGWPQQWQYMVPPATPAPATTPPQPTTTTTKPVTTPATTVPPAMDPAVNPNYPFFSYLPFYPLGWPQLTGATSTSSDSSTNAAPNPPNQYPYYQYPYYFWYGSDPASHLPAATTIMPPPTAGPTTVTPTQPSSLHQAYNPNSQYYPAGVPSQPGFYDQFIQSQYPQHSTECSMQNDGSVSCPNKMPSSSNHLGSSVSYPYSWFPFLQYTGQKNKNLPYSGKYRYPAGYLPGFQTPGFSHQHPVPRVSYLGQEIPQGA